MPRSDWGIIAAFIGCLAVAWLALGDAHYRENKATAANDHSQRTEQIETERAGIPFEAERFASNPEPKNTDERESRDLAAQEASAVWGFWVALIAGAQLIATIFGLYYIRRTLDATREAVEDTGKATVAMQDANEIARESAYVSRRPWVIVDSFEIENVHRYGNGSVGVTGYFIMKNIGLSIAQSVRFRQRVPDHSDFGQNLVYAFYLHKMREATINKEPWDNLAPGETRKILLMENVTPMREYGNVFDVEFDLSYRGRDVGPIHQYQARWTVGKNTSGAFGAQGWSPEELETVGSVVFSVERSISTKMT